MSKAQEMKILTKKAQENKKAQEQELAQNTYNNILEQIEEIAKKGETNIETSINTSIAPAVEELALSDEFDTHLWYGEETSTLKIKW